MVAAHAMKYCSNVPELHQAPSHGCAEKLFFGIGCENMFSVVYKSIIRGEAPECVGRDVGTEPFGRRSGLTFT